MLLGSIVVLDSTSPFPIGNYPGLRSLLCAIFGACIVLAIWSWHPDSFSIFWIGVGAAVGLILGAIGWRWAQYVDF